MKKIFSILNITVMVFLCLSSSCIKPDDKIFFFRMPCIPSVLTNDPENITSHTAYLSGSISGTGSGPITACGINIYASGCYKVHCLPLPEVFIENRYSENTTESTFRVFLRDLSPNTTYHYRAFATNSAGTATGEMKILITLKSPEN
jgi:hypothetical protein